MRTLWPKGSSLSNVFSICVTLWCWGRGGVTKCRVCPVLPDNDNRLFPYMEISCLLFDDIFFPALCSANWCHSNGERHLNKSFYFYPNERCVCLVVCLLQPTPHHLLRDCAHYQSLSSLQTSAFVTPFPFLEAPACCCLTVVISALHWRKRLKDNKQNNKGKEKNHLQLVQFVAKRLFCHVHRREVSFGRVPVDRLVLQEEKEGKRNKLEHAQLVFWVVYVLCCVLPKTNVIVVGSCCGCFVPKPLFSKPVFTLWSSKHDLSPLVDKNVTFVVSSQNKAGRVVWKKQF